MGAKMEYRIGARMWLIMEIKLRCMGIRFGGGGYNRWSSNGVVRGGACMFILRHGAKSQRIKCMRACVCVYVDVNILTRNRYTY